MTSIFGQTFLSVSEGLLIIFIVAGIAAFLTHTKLISQEIIDGFSKLTVRIFLPFLIFYTITSGFDPEKQTYWWKIPLLAIALPSVGLLLSWLVFFKNAKRKKSYFPLASMQNAAYLILLLVNLFTRTSSRNLHSSVFWLYLDLVLLCGL